MKIKNLLNIVVMLASVQVFAIEPGVAADTPVLDEKTLGLVIEDATESGMQYSYRKLESVQAYVHSVLEGYINTGVIFEKDDVSNSFRNAVATKDLATVLVASKIWGGDIKDFGDAFSAYADGHDGWNALVFDMMKEGALIPNKEEISAAITSFYSKEPKQDL